MNPDTLNYISNLGLGGIVFIVWFYDNKKITGGVMQEAVEDGRGAGNIATIKSKIQKACLFFKRSRATETNTVSIEMRDS
jgi:hypothetical protein